MTITQYSCPNCGSSEVQELVAVWENKNALGTFDMNEYSAADLYRETKWCETCGDNIETFVEVEVDEEAA